MDYIQPIHRTVQEIGYGKNKSTRASRPEFIFLVISGFKGSTYNGSLYERCSSMAMLPL